MLTEYTSSIQILSEGCDNNTGTGGARHSSQEHDFVGASDLSQSTSVAFLGKEVAFTAIGSGHLSRESILGTVEPRF